MGMSASAQIVFGVDLKDRNPLLPWIEEKSGYGYNAIEGDGDEPYDLIELLPEYVELEKEFSPWVDPRYLAYAKEEEAKPYSEQQDWGEWKTKNLWFEKASSIWHKKKDELEATIPFTVKRYGYHEECSYALVLKGAPEIYVYDYGSASFQSSDLQLDFQTAMRLDEDVPKLYEKIPQLPEFKDPSWLLLVSYG